MSWFSEKRVLIFYGVLMALLLILLEAINYKTLLRQLDLQVYSAILAIVFLTVGIMFGYLGYQWRIAQKDDSTIVAIHQLSQRELDVLKLMAAGLSNQEIADRLYVSLNTIKTHASNIYGKLNVKRRTQAIDKGRQMKLF